MNNLSRAEFDELTKVSRDMEYIERKMIELSLAITTVEKLMVLKSIYDAGYDTCMHDNNL